MSLQVGSSSPWLVPIAFVACGVLVAALAIARARRTARKNDGSASRGRRLSSYGLSALYALVALLAVAASAEALASAGLLALARGRPLLFTAPRAHAQVLADLGDERLVLEVVFVDLGTADPELAHCLTLVDPTVVLASPRYTERLDTLSSEELWSGESWTFGDDYEARLRASDQAPMRAVDPEAGLLILYTSGTRASPRASCTPRAAT